MGAYTPFSLDVTSFMHADSSNELIVRVAALSRTKDVDGMVLKFLPASKHGWYYVFGGIWGKVVLEALPLISCEAVAIFPDLYREIAEVEVALNNRHPNFRQASLRLQILAPDGAMVSDQSTEVGLYPGLNRFVYRVSMPQPYAWDCDHPYLYQMITEVEFDGQVDRTSTTFGMRDFTVQDGQFLLNGSPIYIQGVLLQPHYPINLVTPPDPEMLVREITLVKEAGFNLLRSHLRPSPPGLLELTDRLGILVYAETSLGWIKDNPVKPGDTVIVMGTGGVGMNAVQGAVARGRRQRRRRRPRRVQAGEGPGARRHPRLRHDGGGRELGQLADERPGRRPAIITVGVLTAETSRRPSELTAAGTRRRHRRGRRQRGSAVRPVRLAMSGSASRARSTGRPARNSTSPAARPVPARAAQARRADHPTTSSTTSTRPSATCTTARTSAA